MKTYVKIKNLIVRACGTNVFTLALIILFSIPIFSVAQPRYNVINEIDRLVGEADSLSNKSQRTFSLNKFIGNDRTYKETWHYSEKAGKIIVFQINYAMDSLEYSEVYYLHRGRLICSEEYETISYSTFEDELKWGGIYFFERSTPRHVVTIGRRNNSKDFTDSPEMTALSRFEQRFYELQRHIPILPR